MKGFLFFAGIMGFLLCSTAVAGEPGYQFLTVGVGPGATGMGDSYHARYDISAVFVNPAGAGKVNGREMIAGYGDYLQDVGAGFALYGQNIRGIGVVGGGFLYYNYGDFNGYDDLGNQVKDFAASDLSLFVFGSREIDTRTHVGITLKYIASTIERYHSSALAMDLGTIYEPQEDVLVGISLLNVGMTTNAYDQKKERLPLSLQVGASKRLSQVPIVIEADLQEMNRKGNFFSRWSLGAEWQTMDFLFLRAGYNNLKRQDYDGGSGVAGSLGGLSLGFGLQHEKYVFEYSVAAQGIGLVNRFSVRCIL